MKILGLTGSIGMGKSTAARQLRGLKVSVYDADAAVHRLMEKGGEAVPMIALVFPHVVFDGAVERARLGARVFDEPEALKTLEAILHPLVRRERARFLARARRRRLRLVALDIPLLFETGAEKGCDKVAVVSCPAFLQTQRVLARPGMTAGKLHAVRSHQLPDAAKRKKADYVVPTGLGLRVSRNKLARLVREMRG